MKKSTSAQTCSKKYWPVNGDTLLIAWIIRILFVYAIISCLLSCQSTRYGKRCEGAAKFIGTGHSTKTVLKNNRH